MGGKTTSTPMRRSMTSSTSTKSVTAAAAAAAAARATSLSIGDPGKSPLLASVDADTAASLDRRCFPDFRPDFPDLRVPDLLDGTERLGDCDATE